MRAVKLLGGVAVFLACLSSSAVCYAQTAPLYAVPFVSEVTPPSLPANSTTTPSNLNFTLTILGANFTSNAVVNLVAPGGCTIHPTTTTVNASGSQITAQFTNAYVSPSTLVLTVTNPAGSGATSNPYYLPKTPAEPSVVLNQNSTSYLSGSGKGIVSAYLGASQNLDFAVVSQMSNTVSIQSSNGFGAFTLEASFVTGNQPWGIVAADFFGYGQSGLAITNSLDNTVSILLPNAPGAFRPGNLITLPGVFPTQIVAADFNGDGRIDLAVLNTCGTGSGGCFPQSAPQGPGTVTILLGNGDGTFTISPTVLTTGNVPYAMVAADFNGDGIIDLAVANSGSNNVTLLMGNGDGTFTPATNSVTTGNNPSGMTVGDFNGDGQLDLAVTNSADNTVSILFNQNCSGGPAVACTFAPALTAPAVGGAPSAIATGDLNADGNLDLVVTNASGNSVSVLLGDGTGNFTAVIPQGTQSFATGYSPQAAVLGDFNQDGRLDIVTSNASGTFTYLQQAAAAQLSLSSDNTALTYGQFATFTAYLTPPSGQPTPASTVTFFDGSTPIGTVSINGYQAILQYGALNAGVHQITAVFNGDNNFLPAASNAVTETVGEAQTNTILSANVASVPYGQPFTLTATIQAPAMNPATGTIKFFDTTTSTDLGDISPVVNQAQVTLSNLAVGTHVIVATYSGDNNFNGSSSATLTETIFTALTITTVSASPSPAIFGQTVTFTATVQPGTGNTATGTVLFFDNGAQAGSGTLTNNTAFYSTTALSVGTHAITAQYTGDANFASSTSSASPATINPVGTTTTLASSLNPSSYGQSVSYNATVKATFGTLPAGTISYFDGTTLLGALSTAAGPTQLTISSLTAGAHNITAQYSTANTNFTGSTSAALTQTVSQTATTTTINLLSNGVPYGTAAQVLVIVNAPYPYSSSTGTITLYDGGTSIQTAAMQGNGVNFAVSGLTAGTHSLTASFSGDSNLLASTSSAHTQTIVQEPTVTTLTPSSLNLGYGQPLTLSASVKPTNGTIATGTIAFLEGTTPIGTVTLTSNAAQLTLSNVTPGTHSYIAQYSGDANTASSVGSAGVTAAGAPTTTIVTANPNPAVLNQTVAFTATIQHLAGGTPTGTVWFYSGTTLLGTSTVINGSAQLTDFSGFAVSTQSITATYGGDSNFSGSTSAVLSEVVNPGPTTTTISASPNPSIFNSSVNFTVSVDAFPITNGLATGLVTLYDGTVSLGSLSLPSGHDYVVFTVSTLTPGTHSITAQYAGSASLTPSTSSVLSQMVNLPATTTTLSSSVNPAGYGQAITLIASIQTPGSGTATGTVTFYNGAASLGTSPVSGNSAQLSVSAIPVGSNSLTAKYGGDGNYAASTSASITETINSTATTTTVSSNANPATPGQTITLTANVSPAFGGTSTGAITFFDGTTSLGVVPVSSNSAQLSLPSLSVGSHSITAKYSGDNNFSASTSVALSQTVNLATTSTSVTSGLNPAMFGQAVTIGVTVQSSVSGTPTGTVTLMDGTTSVATGNLAGGNVQLTVNGLSGGLHSITAVYSGDANFAGSTSGALAETVNAAASSTALTSSSGTATVGQTITLTATVQPSAGSTASGTATFFDGTTAIGTATLASNSAQLAVSTLTPGTHSITATYGGNGNLAGSSSAAVVETITQASTTMTITSGLNPAAFGQAVQFIGTVQTPSGGAATGTVTFFDSTTSLGTATVTNNGSQRNSVTLYYSGFMGGTHTITASYSGDANYAASTSAPLAETVTQASSTASLASGLNPATFGQSVTFTATVQPSISGDFAGGTVTFYDGATPLGTVSLSSEVAQLSLSYLGAGAHSITAKYSGDGNFAGSTSSVLAETINQASTTVTVASNANPSTFGQATTLSATIQSGFGGNSTGTITFLDGAVSLGTGSVSGNAAQLSIASLAVGTHSLTAKYSGDANSSASTSSALSQTINQASTTAIVAPSVNPAAFGQSVIFTVKVQAPSSGAPTGTVTLLDGATSLGSSALPSNGIAQFTINGFSLGSHSITSTYGGDASFSGSVSAALTQVVNQASTTTSLSSSTNPASYGQSVTFTASVVPSFGGAPTGTVTFLDGGVPIGTAAVSANVARLTTAATALNAGSHSITASYSGDGNFGGSSAAVFSQTVSGAATTTTLVSSLDPSVAGQSVKFTATVSSTVIGTQSGTVSFYLDGSTTPAQSSVISGGAAAFSTNSLSGGSHTVSAVFVSTNPNSQGSSSAPLTQNVKDFSISASPASITISRSKSGTITLTVAPVAGFSGDVSLSCSGAPASTNCNVSPNQLTLNSTSSAQTTATIKVNGNATVGTYTLTFKGTSGSATYSVTVSLTIN